MMSHKEPDFRLLFESAPGLFLVLSPELQIVAASDTYLTATMTKRDEILGRDIFDVFPDNPDDPSATGTSNLRASLLRVLQNQASDNMAIQKYDIQRPKSEGGGYTERYWSPVNFPVFDKEKKVQYLIHRVEDVTEFVKLKQAGIEQHKEGERLRSQVGNNEKLRQSQRMEAMGQLAGGVAHDFNNLLSIVIMNCDIILGMATTDGRVRKSLEQIKKTSERAATLTRQLLAFSRKQVFQPRPLNLNTVVNSLEIMLKRLLNEDIELNTKLADDLGNTLSDQGQIEQIILNLVVNARDAMPNGGKITIETSNATLDRALADGNPKVEPGSYIMLAVKDTGVGMDAQTQARIFEPFFTTKDVGRGTGLGLATVYGIVNQNKGTIWVYSEPNKGTVFKIYLPLILDAVRTEPLVDKSPHLLIGNETILVVEDQIELRELVCDTLSANGYKIFQAENGSQALAMIQSHPKLFNLIITDVVMPEMGGQALANELKVHGHNIKLLYLSGYTEETLTTYGVSGTNPHFLEKPFTGTTLLQKVRSILS